MSTQNQESSDDALTSKSRNLLFPSTSSSNILENKNIFIILASQSPRRGEILDMMGLKGKYIQIPSPLNESNLQKDLKSRLKPPSPSEYVELLSKAKASAMADSLAGTVTETTKDILGNQYDKSRPTLIIGSDTIVDLDGTILEKPVNKMDACDTLKRLSGNSHYVHTGVAIYYVPPQLNMETTSESTNTSGSSTNTSIDTTPQLLSNFVETTQVEFTQLTQQDILAYVETGEPMDKAGSYGIQGIGGQMVKRIDGDYFCVMGLPMHRNGSIGGHKLNIPAETSFEMDYH